MTSEERQRLDEIEALAKAAETVFQPVVRRVADQIYEDVLYSVQDYLKENLAFNTAQDIASEKRRAQEFLTLAHRTRFSFAVAAACIESRATAAEARVAVLEGLLEDYDTRILLAHDALEAARDKMRGAVEEDDQRVYDRVHTAIYVLRSRQSRALVAKLGRVDG